MTGLAAPARATSASDSGRTVSVARLHFCREEMRHVSTSSRHLLPSLNAAFSRRFRDENAGCKGPWSAGQNTLANAWPTRHNHHDDHELPARPMSTTNGNGHVAVTTNGHTRPVVTVGVSAGADGNRRPQKTAERVAADIVRDLV